MFLPSLIIIYLFIYFSSFSLLPILMKCFIPTPVECGSFDNNLCEMTFACFGMLEVLIAVLLLPVGQLAGHSLVIGSSSGDTCNMSQQCILPVTMISDLGSLVCFS